jgi:hypothetical protein
MLIEITSVDNSPLKSEEMLCLATIRTPGELDVLVAREKGLKFSFVPSRRGLKSEDGTLSRKRPLKVAVRGRQSPEKVAAKSSHSAALAPASTR